MLVGDPVKIVVPEVTILSYDRKKHQVEVTPSILGANAIKHNIVWGSVITLSANTLGLPYKKYEDQILVDLGGIEYYKTLVQSDSMYKFARIRAKHPKLRVRFSFNESIPALQEINGHISKKTKFSLEHLEGIIYSKKEADDVVIIQSFKGLLYYINPRLILPLD